MLTAGVDWGENVIHVSRICCWSLYLTLTPLLIHRLIVHIRHPSYTAYIVMIDDRRTRQSRNKNKNMPSYHMLIPSVTCLPPTPTPTTPTPTPTHTPIPQNPVVSLSILTKSASCEDLSTAWNHPAGDASTLSLGRPPPSCQHCHTTTTTSSSSTTPSAIDVVQAFPTPDLQAVAALFLRLLHDPDAFSYEDYQAAKGLQLLPRR